VAYLARNTEQNERMKEERKDRILKETLKQFTSKGLFATKIKDIAEGAGMAQGLLYHYYKSKEEIYVELVNNALDKINTAARSLEAVNKPAHEKIRSCIIEILKTIENSDDFNQTCRFISQATNSTAIPLEAQQLILSKRNEPYQIISRIFKQGQEDGTIVEGDTDQLAVLFWTTLNGLAILKASGAKNPSFPEADLLTRFYLK
jgi:TetR/AcrR family transcriptional regulator